MASVHVVNGDDLDSDDISDAAETMEDKTNPGCGITDVMSKILNNTVPESKGIILGRGQTDHEIRKKRKLKEKEDKAEGKPVKKKKKKRSEQDEESSSDWTDDDEDSRRKSFLQMKKKRDLERKNRVKPNLLNKEKERILQKIATRGVVQVFNAVRQQQNTVKEKMEEAGPSVRRRDKVMGSISKKHFLDLLDNTQAKSAAEAKERTAKPQDKDTSEQGKKWNILRDDFMMNARMKDWDRDSDEAEGD